MERWKKAGNNMKTVQTGQRLSYFCTAHMVRGDYGGFRKSYRFNVVDMSGGQPRPLLICNDVCFSDEEAHELETLFRRNHVSAVHIMDVLEDWVAYRRKKR
jgi:hypothetical protein